jgi:hypothetical protein
MNGRTDYIISCVYHTDTAVDNHLVCGLLSHLSYMTMCGAVADNADVYEP